MDITPLVGRRYKTPVSEAREGVPKAAVGLSPRGSQPLFRRPLLGALVASAHTAASAVSAALVQNSVLRQFASQQAIAELLSLVSCKPTRVTVLLGSRLFLV